MNTALKKQQISIEQAEEIAASKLQSIISTIEDSLTAIKKPGKNQLGTEGNIAKIYFNNYFLRELDYLDKLQKQINLKK